MENLEILKDVLSPETYSAVERETKDSDIRLTDLKTGEFISKSKYDALFAQSKDTQKLLETRTAEYEQLKAAAGDNETLKRQIDTMKTAFEQEKADIQKKADAQLKQARVTAQIISDYKPKDVKDILAHIDFEKISADGDKLVGLKEQVDPIKEAKAYLFESEKTPGASGLEHGGNDSDLSAIRKAFGLADKKE